VTKTLNSSAGLAADLLQTGSQLRALGRAELARLGEESLRSHLVDMAIAAHCRYAPFSSGLLESFLGDRNHVRHPVQLVYARDAMAPHQFAQPEREGDGFILYLHPSLEGNETDIALAVAYFVPVINFGQLVDDDICLLYGATLSGITSDSYYAELCRIADSIGLPARDRSEKGGKF